MKTRLTINGENKIYPDSILDLEKLILFVMDKEKAANDIIVEVRVNGETFSEEYENQSANIRLNDVRTVDVAIQKQEEFAQDFMNQVFYYIDHIQNGFRSAIDLLKDSDQEEDGHDMLARSLDTLRALKFHSDSARRVLGTSAEGNGNHVFWQKFDGLTDRLNDAQLDVDAGLIANLLETEMMPFLEEWKTVA